MSALDVAAPVFPLPIPRTTRVASVPADHVYVRHLAAPDGAGAEAPAPAGARRVVRLAEPRRDGPAGAPWWPSPMLSAAWVEENAHAFDLAHVHFGFDAVGAADLRRYTAALDAAGKPLVFTVHDLRNPHHHDRAAHDAALAALVEGAAELVTLTPGAADVLERRFGWTATVVPHPHVVAPAAAPRRRANRSGPFVVGVHLKSLRANMFDLDIVDVLADAVAPLAGARLQVDVHEVVDDPGHHTHRAGLVAALRERHAAGRIDLCVHPFLTDDELWGYLRSLDVSVLPYRFGTHSGWLEACADLGTTVVAPRCGWYHQQQPVLGYDADDDGFDADQLVAAVRTAHRDRPVWQADPTWRRAQRTAIAAVHDVVYERAISAAWGRRP